MTVTLKFSPERGMPDKILEVTPAKTVGGTISIEFTERDKEIHATLYEESPGVFREAFYAGDQYGAMLMALMQAGKLPDCSIPVADFLNLNDDSHYNGHLSITVKDGMLCFAMAPLNKVA